MANAKKITTFALALIVPISLLSGYFCYAMPPVAHAATIPIMPSLPSCQDAPQNHYMLTDSNDGRTVAPCCAEKSEKNQEDAAVIAGFSFDNTVGELASTDEIVRDYSAISYAASLNYSISPPPIELLASIIKIE